MQEKKKPLSNFPAFLKTRDLTDVGADGSVTESTHAHAHTHTGSLCIYLNNGKKKKKQHIAVMQKLIAPVLLNFISRYKGKG